MPPVEGPAVVTLLGTAGTKILFGSAVNTVKGQLFKHLDERKHQKQEAALSILLETVAASLSAANPEAPTDDEVRQALGDTVTLEDTLLDAFRHMVHSLDDEAIPCIARLHAMYFRERRPRDAFYRNVGRMLENASFDDIVRVRAVVDAVQDCITGMQEQLNGLPTRLTARLRTGALVCDGRQDGEGDRQMHRGSSFSEKSIPGCEDAFALLTQARLGRDQERRDEWENPTPVAFSLNAEQIRDWHRLVIVFGLPGGSEQG